MQEPEGFDVRYTKEEDYPFLLSWLKDQENLQWFPMSEEHLDLYAKNWVGFYKYRSSLTATIHDIPVGMVTLFLMPYQKVAHHASFYLIVDRKHLHKGVGSSLLKNVKNLAFKYFRLESIHVEVYENSPLIPLLMKGDFQHFATQPHFVKEKNEYRSRLLFEHAFKKE
jgi:putative acetyltransferase